MRRFIASVLHRISLRTRTWSKTLYTAPNSLIVQRWFADKGDSTLRLEYPLDSSSVVFDVGGYEGQWASDIFSMYLCTVHIFEPMSKFAARITTRFMRNPHMKVYAYGLAGKNTTAQMAALADGSSIFRQSAQTETTQLRDVMDVIAELGVERIDLLKLNIEGGEYELLERIIENGFHTKIRDIQVQFHAIAADSEERMERIRRELEKTHELTYSYRFVWENWRLKETHH